MKITDHVDRVDIKDKLCGKTKYIEDMTFDNLHFARTLRSTVTKGKILSIEYPPAEEGITVVDHKDVKGHNEVAMILKDMPVFAKDQVNYYGEPIALIVGRDKDQIISFFNRTKVTYEELPFVDDFKSDQAEVFTDHTFSIGSFDELEYDDIFESVYNTGYQEQVYMEKQGVVGIVEDDIITVYGSLQCPYYVLNALKHALETEDVRVVQTPTGGAFGGKEEYPSLLAIQVAVAASKVQAPVRLIFDRREDMAFTTKRHPSESKTKTYIKDKKIVGMDYAIKLDSGPYLGLSDVVLQRAIFTMMGCYMFDVIRVNGKTVKTNNVFTGAFRGFGAPQSMYALELHMSQLADYLGLDQIDFRKTYFVKQGDMTSTGGVFNETICLDEITDKLKDIIDYDKIKSAKEPYVGYGFSFIPHGGGFTGDGEAAHIKAIVHLKKETNGDVTILVSNVEMGQGAITALSKIVAATLDYPIERVHYHRPDTKYVPDSGPTVASRTTMVVGNLLHLAAKKLKDRLDEPGEILIEERFKQPDYVKWDQDKLHGNAYMAYSWSALMARVEMDPITYEVTCTDIYGVYDVGVPVDERLLIGQIQGGVVQGLGYGLLEKMDTKDGLIQQHSFSNYVIPTTCDIPTIHCDWVINKYVDGPFGAKAVGELTLVGVAPAVASAVEDIIHKHINVIPVTPERVMEAMNED
ncbi:xanthine dehydrogenase family protein [Acidaminobacter sp. JC074]|uniref:xanthine dehydrogenase family protein molybdopterin-binding subunit n=1 Tax=Acidaminobacter sp. JC074 TaxID=2530199 RepID=UPI001F0FD09E|nr:xanthine dehydrogenase family protein molybdopterin-binding subunit [Acidaminobacter sp. JC074]MCH4889762.1 xanthine dehydrogenase family protein [Acidaminobacter sp. JC074]